MSKDNRVVIIAVMGATGVGKSTFIQLVTGREDVKVGDTLFSETQKVCEYDFFYKGKSYILVDTPGFDDSHRSDTEVTGLILRWLKDSMVSGQRLNGVIYLHRISDGRMGGTALRNTRMFRKLVGEHAFRNVILATTFWEQVSDQDAVQREKEIRGNGDFWGGMLENGARIVRLRNEREAGLRLLEQIAGNGKIVLEAQDEIVNQGKSIVDTAAARELGKQAEELERKLEETRRAEERRLKKDMETQKKRQAELVRTEQEKMERKLEAEREAERDRQAREEEDAQEYYEQERKQREADQQRQEEQRRREIKELAKQRKEELERREWQEKELNRRHQRRYVCIGYKPKGTCAICRGNLTCRKYYYHCCFCKSDKYFCCGACGPRCRNKSHPALRRVKSPRNYCIVM